MADNIAKELIDMQSRLESDRATYDHHCEEVARYVVPRLDDFFFNTRTPGEKRTQYQFDSTAPLALNRFSSIIEALVAPRGQLWHGLEPEDEELLEDHEVMLWFERVRNALFRLRYGPGSNFASQFHEMITSLGAFGTGVLITQERPGQWMRYKSSHIREHFFTENEHGLIDANWRKYKLTARQAMNLFGDEVSDIIKNSKSPTEKFYFLHCVMPNNGVGMPYISYHVEMNTCRLLRKPGGYRKFPFIISRYTTSPDEIYGRSPAMDALAEIKMLNSMRKTDLRSRHMAIDPPNLAANEMTVRKFNAKPGAMNYGALDISGNQLVRPYQTGARIELSNDAIEQSRKIVNDIFLVTLFQILIETPEMTATEVLARQQEKGDLLSPIGGRLESETLSKLVEREIDYMAVSGAFDGDGPFPMPDALRERGGAFKVTYNSPMTRMRLAGEAAGAERTIQSLIPVAQINPNVFDPVDWDEYTKIISRANGAPIRLMKSPQQVAQARQKKEAQEQLMMAAQAAPQVAGAVKDIAQAQTMV